MNCNLLRSHGRIFCFCLWVVILCPSFVSLVRSRSGCLGFGSKLLRTYFLSSSECSGCFRCKLIGSYVLAVSVLHHGWSGGSQTSHKLLAWKPVFPVPVAFLFPVRTVFPELHLFLYRPSRARDLVIMVEVGSARLTSLECVTHYGCRISFPGR